MSGQDHNDSAPGSGFLDVVVNKSRVVRVYLPPDANCLLSVMDTAAQPPLRQRRGRGKHPAAVADDGRSGQALRTRHRSAVGHNDRSVARRGHGLLWRRAHAGTLAAVSIMREHARLKIRVVNVVDS